MARLSTNHYGKGAIRLVKVHRGETEDRLMDLTLDIHLEGNFVEAYLAGNNELILPTDTMKNTVYGFAAEHSLESIEPFAIALAEHFVKTNPQSISAKVEIEQTIWRRLRLDGKPDPNNFLKGGGSEKRTTSAHATQDVLTVRGGLHDLCILRTSGTAFIEYVEDRYTTLLPAPNRMLNTTISARWTYEDVEDVDFDDAYRTIRDALLQVFAVHDSKSVQHTLFAMGEEALKRCSVIRDIDLRLPNIHCLAVDLEPFELENPPLGKTEVFHAVDEPYGIIWATVGRD